MFYEDRCDLCGECLVKCKYIEYDTERAVAEVKALINREPAPLLSQCLTCAACNEFCPQRANPFDLISELQDKYHSLNILDKAKSVMSMTALMPSELRSGIPGKPAISLCVMEPMAQDALSGPMFEGLTLIKGGKYFCQVGWIHLGMESVSRDKAQAFVDALAETGQQEIICFHDDCYAMLTGIAPQYGIEVPFRPVHLLQYLKDYLTEHQSQIRPLRINAAYQRPCASRYSPAKDHLLDEIFELIGVSRPKRKYENVDALCCSAPYLSRGNKDAAIKVQDWNMRDAKDAGAEIMVCLCPMCKRTLAPAGERHRLPLIMIGDLCRRGLGEDI